MRSQFAKIDLKSNSTLELFIFFKTDSRFHSPNFNLFIEDSDFYQRTRTFKSLCTRYFIGCIIFFSYFGWYSVFRNRQATELTYGIWILFGFLVSLFFMSMVAQDFLNFFNLTMMKKLYSSPLCQPQNF